MYSKNIFCEMLNLFICLWLLVINGHFSITFQCFAVVTNTRTCCRGLVTNLRVQLYLESITLAPPLVIFNQAFKISNFLIVYELFRLFWLFCACLQHITQHKCRKKHNQLVKEIKSRNSEEYHHAKQQETK